MDKDDAIEYSIKHDDYTENLFKPIRVMVYGNINLDRDAIGVNDGYSREVYKLPCFTLDDHDVYSPGGGGNLAAQFTAYGMETYVVGTWGPERDRNRRELEICLEELGIHTTYMVEYAYTGTFEKFYHPNGINVQRIDRALRQPITGEVEDRLLDNIRALSEYIDVCVVADYDEHGGCLVTSPILQELAALSVPTFATSRTRIDQFYDFDYLVMDTEEYEAVPRETYFDGAAMLLNELRPKGVVVTREGKGAIMRRGDGVLECHTIPIVHDIFPCGCGDTFLATLVCALLSNYEEEEALLLANMGARVVVRKKFGTGSALPSEVCREIWRNGGQTHMTRKER